MSGRLDDPTFVLPHGPGMRLVEDPRDSGDGWLVFKVRQSADLVVYDAAGLAPAELGLEIMAQACGMAAAWNAAGETPRTRRGVVGAIKGYEYGTELLARSDAMIARVKSDLEGGSVLVCDAELSREGGIAPLQKARVTIVFMEGD